ATVWSPASRESVHRAFVGTGRPYAQATFERVATIMDGYTTSWSAMHREACEATAVRHTQSPALLDLRMACLDRRLTRFGELAAVFARESSDAVLSRAVQAAGSLDELRGCADAGALAAVPLPSSKAVQARLAALRPRLDRLAALANTTPDRRA